MTRDASELLLAAAREAERQADRLEWQKFDRKTAEALRWIAWRNRALAAQKP